MPTGTRVGFWDLLYRYAQLPLYSPAGASCRGSGCTPRRSARRCVGSSRGAGGLGNFAGSQERTTATALAGDRDVRRNVVAKLQRRVDCTALRCGEALEIEQVVPAGLECRVLEHGGLRSGAGLLDAERCDEESRQVLRVQIAEVQNVANTSKNSMSAYVYVCFIRMPKDRMIRTAAP